MSELKYCQGPDCHTYTTQDRLKGIKGSKTYQTRRRSNLIYDEFCDTRCYNDWFATYGTRAVDQAGRIYQPLIMTKENSWTKCWGYRNNNYDVRQYYYRNVCTNEERPLTESQYNDNNYTLNS